MLIRYYGHVGLPTGYGDAANEMCMAILEAGLDLEISTDGTQLPSAYLPLAKHIKAEADLTGRPDAIIVHTLPLDCVKLAQSRGLRSETGRLVAYTTWEGASELPWEMGRGLADTFYQVWWPSQATQWAAGLGALSCVVPHPYDDQQDRPESVPSPDGVFRFYYVGAWAVRKNVEGMIRAYLRAFDRGDNVELIIQAASAPDGACQLAQMATGIPPAQMPVIRFSNQRVNRETILRLHAECQCFVTATRGEAWSLAAFDAMLAERHIIAPSGQGSDAFLLETSTAFCKSQLAPAGGEVRLAGIKDGMATAHYLGSQGLTAKSLWQEPDLCDLARLMRRSAMENVHELDVGYDPAERFGRRAVGAQIRQLLEGERDA